MSNQHFHALYMKTHIIFRCPECEDSTYEEDLPKDHIIDISSNEYGEDVVKYKCPECKEIVESKRYTYRGGR